MLGKLLKNDLKKNMRWMWILFVGSIITACLTRGCAELGRSIAFFKIVSIIFDSVFYTLIANSIIHPFLRSFLNFTKSIYGDESYLTHTLPVTKNQIFNSKILTAIIEILLGFICLVVSLLIRFVTPTFFTTLKFILATVISGSFSVTLLLILFMVLVLVEFLMFISIIFFSIVKAYKAKEKRVLKAFLITALMSFISLSVLSVVMVIVLLINKISLSSSVLVLPNTAFISVMLSGIIVYLLVSVIFYLLTRKELNKGVNVD